MQELKVCQILKEDVYKDIIRVPEHFRVNENGENIVEGSICLVSVDAVKSKTYAILRGSDDTEPCLKIDERLRNKLGVHPGETHRFTFEKSDFMGWFKWAWDASEIGYRVSTRIAVISLVLGVISFAVSVLN